VHADEERGDGEEEVAAHADDIRRVFGARVAAAARRVGRRRRRRRRARHAERVDDAIDVFARAVVEDATGGHDGVARPRAPPPEVAGLVVATKTRPKRTSSLSRRAANQTENQTLFDPARARTTLYSFDPG